MKQNHAKLYSVLAFFFFFLSLKNLKFRIMFTKNCWLLKGNTWLIWNIVLCLPKLKCMADIKWVLIKTPNSATANQAGNLKCCGINSSRKKYLHSLIFTIFCTNMCERTPNFCGIMLTSNKLNDTPLKVLPQVCLKGQVRSFSVLHGLNESWTRTLH